MIIATVDTSGWRRAMLEFQRRTGVEMCKVVAKECAELIKTLTRFLPPVNRATTRKKIAAKINSRFSAAGAETKASRSGDMLWYGFTSNWIHGVAPDRDLRHASVATLQKLYATLDRRGVQILPFRKARKTQRVKLVQRLVTKPSKIKRLVAQVQGNIGKLRASFLVAVTRGYVQLTGANLPPHWVMKHAATARGDAINQLSVPLRPGITLISRAAGVSKRYSLRIIRNALAVRINAMRANAQQYLRGRKRISNYK